MARAQGARAQMALAFETVYGTPPGSGFTQMPFITSSLAAEQPLLASELLGYGRDPRAPLLDAITTDGDVEVPIDACRPVSPTGRRPASAVRQRALRPR